MNKESLYDLWDSIQKANVRVIRISEEDEKEKEAENLFKDKLAENFQAREKAWTFMFKKRIYHPIVSMPKDLLQDRL